MLVSSRKVVECGWARLGWIRRLSININHLPKLSLIIVIMSNSNWTEWSAIYGEILRVISKSDEREARGRFEITRTITP